jgi:hypothetical protein
VGDGDGDGCGDDVGGPVGPVGAGGGAGGGGLRDGSAGPVDKSGITGGALAGSIRSSCAEPEGEEPEIARAMAKLAPKATIVKATIAAVALSPTGHPHCCAKTDGAVTEAREPGPCHGAVRHDVCSRLPAGEIAPPAKPTKVLHRPESTGWPSAGRTDHDADIASGPVRRSVEPPTRVRLNPQFGSSFGCRRKRARAARVCGHALWPQRSLARRDGRPLFTALARGG